MKKGTLAVLLLLAMLCCTALRPAHAVDMGRLRFVNAGLASGVLEARLDDTPALQNARFGSVTSYAALAPATYSLDLYSGGAKKSGGPVQVKIGSHTDYTALIFDGAKGTGLQTLVDDNSRPPADSVRLRFVNASAAIPALDLIVKDGAPVAHNVAQGQAGGYAVLAAGTYTFDVQQSGTGASRLRLSNLNLTNGSVYTIFVAGGTGPQLNAFVTVDSVYAPISVPQALPHTGQSGQVTPMPPPAVIWAIALCAVVALGITHRYYLLRKGEPRDDRA